MNLKNSVTLIGHLGRDPEFIKLESGRMLSKFSIATNESYRNQNGDRITHTEWHNCIAWGPKAEVINNLFRKGKQVALRGKLIHRSYDDKDGIRRYVSEVQIEEFEILSKKEPA
jgi:single-strand DNA-binding protein